MVQRLRSQKKKRSKHFVWATRVVTRNFIKDFIGELQNIIGKRITAYELMINKAIKDAFGEIGEVTNPRIEITQLTNGSVAIVVYGVKIK